MNYGMPHKKVTLPIRKYCTYFANLTSYVITLIRTYILILIHTRTYLKLSIQNPFLCTRYNKDVPMYKNTSYSIHTYVRM